MQKCAHSRWPTTNRAQAAAEWISEVLNATLVLAYITQLSMHIKGVNIALTLIAVSFR